MTINSDSPLDIIFDSIWNHDIEFKAGRRGEILKYIILHHWNDKKALDFLEIGVYKAGTSKFLFKNLSKLIKTYTGVDPYLGSKEDPYTGPTIYWNSPDESGAVYEHSKNIYMSYGHNLIRKSSREYFMDTTETYDVIFVDGDHREVEALWDLTNWFKRLRSGGLLMADDYGNSDTPHVTGAVDKFYRTHSNQISRSGFWPLFFKNKGKAFPIQLSIVYFEKPPLKVSQ